MNITATNGRGESVLSGYSSNDDLLLVTFSSSEPTEDFTKTDVTTFNGSLTNFTKISPTVYIATFTPTLNGPQR